MKYVYELKGVDIQYKTRNVSWTVGIYTTYESALKRKQKIETLHLLLDLVPERIDLFWEEGNKWDNVVREYKSYKDADQQLELATIPYLEYKIIKHTLNADVAKR